MLKRKLYSGILVCLLITSASAQEVLICKDGSATFFSEAPMENIEAKSNKLASALNTKTKKIVFKVRINTFQFEKAIMQEHFNENYMESDKYPTAIFNGAILEDVRLEEAGTHEVTVDGTLTMHGVEQQRQIRGTLVVGEGEVRGKAQFMVRLADHDIKIPSVLFYNISEEVLVTVEMIYLPKADN